MLIKQWIYLTINRYGDLLIKIYLLSLLTYLYDFWIFGCLAKTYFNFYTFGKNYVNKNLAKMKW